jgi:hypothetical protein
MARGGAGQTAWELLSVGIVNAVVADREMQDAVVRREGTVEKHVRSHPLQAGAGDTPDDHRRVLAVMTFLDAR